MKIYQLRTEDCDEGTIISYAGSMTEINKIRKELKDVYPTSEEYRDVGCDVIKTKSDLLWYLKYRTPNRDNG